MGGRYWSCLSQQRLKHYLVKRCVAQKITYIIPRVKCGCLTLILGRLVSKTLYLTSGCTKYFLLA